MCYWGNSQVGGADYISVAEGSIYVYYSWAKLSAVVLS